MGLLLLLTSLLTCSPWRQVSATRLGLHANTSLLVKAKIGASKAKTFDPKNDPISKFDQIAVDQHSMRLDFQNTGSDFQFGALNTGESRLNHAGRDMSTLQNCFIDSGRTSVTAIFDVPQSASGTYASTAGVHVQEFSHAASNLLSLPELLPQKWVAVIESSPLSRISINFAKTCDVYISSWHFEYNCSGGLFPRCTTHSNASEGSGSFMKLCISLITEIESLEFLKMAQLEKIQGTWFTTSPLYIDTLYMKPFEKYSHGACSSEICSTEVFKRLQTSTKCLLLDIGPYANSSYF